jgi:tRNA U38,U39,U40 pseudouridine synthase TruA
MRHVQGAVNPEIRAQKSIHYILGTNFVFRSWKRPFKFTGELYYKKFEQLIPYEIENVRQRYYATNNAVGYAYGADAMVNGEFIPGVQSWIRASYLKTEEDLLDDQYYLYLNQSGDTIYSGFTIDDVAVDSTLQTPGYIPRPTDQRFSFSLLFMDEMPRNPKYKATVNMFFSKQDFAGGKQMSGVELDELVARVNQLASKYLGTHSFHNFSKGYKNSDPSSARYIIGISV